jgi:hypothetical protein
MDVGTALPSASSGTLTVQFDKTAQPYSDFFFPYIRLWCSQGNSYDVYLGGIVTNGGATPSPMPGGISVYEEGHSPADYPPLGWLNGDGTGQSGTGYTMYSDKHVYNVNEPVKLRWVFNTPFTPAAVALYDDYDSPDPIVVMTGATLITQNMNHYVTITYSAVGEYYPFIEIRSASFDPNDSSTFHHVYVGGESSPNTDYAIAITKEVSPVYVNTGSFLGQYGGTGGIVNTAGIFGFPSWAWAGFRHTGNGWLDAAQSILVAVLRAALWVASNIYNLVSSTDFFHSLNEMIAPTPNAVYTTPSQIFGMALPAEFANQTFRVQYASESSGGTITKVLQFLFGATVLIALVRLVLPHSDQ